MSRWAASACVTVVGCAWILVRFHDQAWWPPDEGQFVHVADRMLGGEQLHRDIRDHHADHVHWINAGALSLFGRDLLSLRYPLVAATLGYGLGVFTLLFRRGAGLAVLTALTATALGFVQFPNPTPNWYGLPLAVLAVACLDARSRWRVFAAGLVVGAMFGFRQLTAVFLGLAVLGYLLADARGAPGSGRGRLARGVLGGALTALCAYLGSTTDLLGWVLFGVWPVALLAWSIRAATTPDRAAAGILVQLAAGFLVALVPMLASHAWHGSLFDWWADVVASAREVPQLSYVAVSSYGHWLRPALDALSLHSSPLGLANAAYWWVLVSLAALTGGLTLRALSRQAPEGRLDLALPYVASFYALVSVFNQIPIYLYYSVGLSLAGLVWLLAPLGTRVRVGLALGVAWVGATALAFHAGQPHTRTPKESVAGLRVPLAWNERLPRASLWMEPDQERAYGDLMDQIRARTRAEDAIWVVPNDAVVYFLAGRRNPVDFWNSALGIGGAASEAALLERLRVDPPALIVHARGDKSTTPALLRVLEALQPDYGLLTRVHYYELLERRGGSSPRRGD